MDWAWWAINKPGLEETDIPWSGDAKKLTPRKLLFAPCVDCCDCTIWVDTFDRPELGPEWTHSGDWHIAYNPNSSNGVLYPGAAGSKCTWVKKVKSTVPRYVVSYRFTTDSSAEFLGTHQFWIDEGRIRCEVEFRPSHQFNWSSYYIRIYDGDKCVGEQGIVRHSYYPLVARVTVDRERDTIRFSVVQSNDQSDDSWPTLSYHSKIESHDIAFSVKENTTLKMTHFKISRDAHDVDGCAKNGIQCRYLEGFADGALNPDVWDIKSGTWATQHTMDFSGNNSVIHLRGEGAGEIACKLDSFADDNSVRFQTALTIGFYEGTSYEISIGGTTIKMTPDVDNINQVKVESGGGFWIGPAAIMLFVDLHNGLATIRYTAAQVGSPSSFEGLDWDGNEIPYWIAPGLLPGNGHSCCANIFAFSPTTSRLSFKINGPGLMTVKNVRLSRTVDDLQQPDFSCDYTPWGSQGKYSRCEGSNLVLDIPSTGCVVGGLTVLDWCGTIPARIDGSQYWNGSYIGWRYWHAERRTDDNTSLIWSADGFIEQLVIDQVIMWRLTVRFYTGVYTDPWYGQPVYMWYSTAWYSTEEEPPTQDMPLHRTDSNYQGMHVVCPGLRADIIGEFQRV